MTITSIDILLKKPVQISVKNDIKGQWGNFQVCVAFFTNVQEMKVYSFSFINSQTREGGLDFDSFE